MKAQMMCQLHPFLDQRPLQSLTLMASWLDYSFVPYMGLLLKNHWKLQLVQNVNSTGSMPSYFKGLLLSFGKLTAEPLPQVFAPLISPQVVLEGICQLLHSGKLEEDN